MLIIFINKLKSTNYFSSPSLILLLIFFKYLFNLLSKISIFKGLFYSNKIRMRYFNLNN